MDEDRNDKNASRELLSKYSGQVTFVQDLFTFMNKVMKHKARNLHLCNHHMTYCFADGGAACSGPDAIEVGNVDQFISPKRSTPTQRKGKRVVIPKLDDILTAVLNGYRILDEEFRADKVRFEQFRQNFQKEIELQAVAAPAKAQENNTTQPPSIAAKVI
jgi:hypothetical protein